MIIGELSALGGSFCWSACSVFFAASARRIGPYALNFVRLFLACGFLALALLLWKGELIPDATTAEDWFWLGLSGVIGLVIGDVLYFSALQSIGPRITLLLFSLAPPVAAAGEWFLFGRGLGVWALVGMAVALSGVALVISEKKKKEKNALFSLTLKGVLFGVFAAFCQGAGLVLSKKGLDLIDPLSGTFIRMLVSALFFAPFFLVFGGKVRAVLKERRAMGLALGGAFFGPFLGVTLSLVAVKHTHAGVAMTILSTMPITILPLSVWVYKEKLTVRAVAGAVVAVLGVAILCL